MKSLRPFAMATGSSMIDQTAVMAARAFSLLWWPGRLRVSVEQILCSAK